MVERRRQPDHRRNAAGYTAMSSQGRADSGLNEFGKSFNIIANGGGTNFLLSRATGAARLT
ncbi:hypothetical protein [Duganella sp. BuS-21]|uniref:hypothetical protein n=1 Tax=Duganella sp. BuS-21 TaxID=2943848 RepID=UPI0035A72A44